MRVGVLILPEHRWGTGCGLWQQAEALGFDHAWTYDHLSWASLRDRTWFATVPTLTAAACVTSRIRLGTLIASPNFRHPVTFAKELVALDDISGGRMIAGLGSGVEGFDAEALGGVPWPRRERTARFAEFVDHLDQLLCKPAVTTRGSYYSATEARTYPGCVQKPRIPFAIAATGPRGMRLAARHAQAWVTLGDTPDFDDRGPGACMTAFQRQVKLLEDACVAEGREPGDIGRILLTGITPERPLLSVEAFLDFAGRYDRAGATDLILHWPRPEPPYHAIPAVFERIATEAVPAVRAGRF
ncbi:LLM class flavin-dependent oxidoreductase [Nonomuraea sp. MTCD27]|uniref:LLM class flavin-dependent oxidoreductase n=1 Tax=Nonomuraea sp. MTCD27 TaxID=1676747 RepID=UPI0035C24555